MSGRALDVSFSLVTKQSLCYELKGIGCVVLSCYSFCAPVVLGSPCLWNCCLLMSAVLLLIVYSIVSWLQSFWCSRFSHLGSVKYDSAACVAVFFNAASAMSLWLCVPRTVDAYGRYGEGFVDRSASFAARSQLLCCLCLLWNGRVKCLLIVIPKYLTELVVSRFCPWRLWDVKGTAWFPLVWGYRHHLPELKCLCHVVSHCSEEESPCCSRVLSEVELVILKRRQSEQRVCCKRFPRS